jgi:lipid II:glycine glycyltransferase (peptidoglycan interpeptide bridge formation enzyme)
MYSIEIDTVSNTEWSRLLQQFDDATIYQTWSCGAVLWGKNRLSHIVLKEHDKVVGLAQVASIQLPFLRRGTALIFWGPVWRRSGHSGDYQLFSHLLKSLRDEYVGRRGMLLRVIPNETGSDEDKVRTILEHVGFQWKGRFYRTYKLDLTPSLADLRKQLRQKWRNCLNRSEKENLTIIRNTDMETYDTFYKIFLEMQGLKQIEEISLDPLRLREIHRDLPEEIKPQIFLCKKEENPLAGAVVSVIGDTAILLLAASNLEGRKVMASYLLQWRIIEWLRMKGMQSYDLGGISPSHPWVNHFKAGIGGENIPHAGIFEQCTNSVSSFFDMSLGILNHSRKHLVGTARKFGKLRGSY